MHKKLKPTLFSAIHEWYTFWTIRYTTYLRAKTYEKNSAKKALFKNSKSPA